MCPCTTRLFSTPSVSSVSRRNILAVPSILNLHEVLKSVPVKAKEVLPWKVVTDPETYSALAYSPPSRELPPLILFLHGAGINERDISNLFDPNGEHASLLPSLVSEGQAPKLLLDEFAILAPYCFGKRSFYQEPRDKLLSFLHWASTPAGRDAAACPIFDPKRVFLFGFSDGATLGVELLTTRRFAGAVLCSYGFTGTLPEYALERLAGLPMWVFHSADDVIFPVSCSDKLVQSLSHVNTKKEIVRYSRFDQDPEGFTGQVKGHTTGITASKDPEVYKWLLSL
jgi:predicted peptidase